MGIYIGGPDPAGLLPMLYSRWAGQACYFANRIATHDMTGVDSPAQNDNGLNDARAWWSGRAADLGLSFLENA